MSSTSQRNGLKAKLTTYKSAPVAIPPTYLLTPPSDAQPTTTHRINFAQTALPEYAACHATILDNVLSPTECTTLLHLAEASVRDEDKSSSPDGWQPALLNVGRGFEAFVPRVRNGDRIVWDSRAIADRLWARIVAVAPPALTAELHVYREPGFRGMSTSVWEVHSLNERLRFLRYSPGQYFRAHCDGEYRPEVEEEGGVVLCTKFTVHLYLNDSRKEAVEGSELELEGGATSFLSEKDDVSKVDVDPKAGRVLIFQHKQLCHCGAEVTAGTKYTLRTDIVYKLRKTVYE